MKEGGLGTVTKKEGKENRRGGESKGMKKAVVG